MFNFLRMDIFYYYNLVIIGYICIGIWYVLFDCESFVFFGRLKKRNLKRCFFRDVFDIL